MSWLKFWRLTLPVMSHQSMANGYPSVLSYSVNMADQDKVLSIIEGAWLSNTSLHIVTLNAEMIIAAQRDERLDKIIRRADLSIADGAGVVLALKLFGYNIKRLPGIELAQAALGRAAAKNIPVALIGGQREALAVLCRTLPEKYTGLKLVACHDGYFQGAEEQSILENIKESEARLVLVAMGVPRQEYFIELARQSASQAVFIGVGGSFDVWSGQKMRAPAIFQRYHLEWLYRLLSEPWRFKRMSMALPEFAWQVVVEFLKKKWG